MDRVAVMVDAGYFFAAGSALVSGSAKQKRSLVVLDEKATLVTLKQLATRVTHGVPLLRIYWYDGAPARSGPSAEHVRLAHCDDLKLRLGFVNAVGQQKGVDSLIVTDLIELARNRAITDAVLLSGDEDVRVGVVIAQSFGVRVHLAGIHPARGTQSTQLMQEADTCVELGVDVVRHLISVQAERAVASAPVCPTSIGDCTARTKVPGIESFSEIDAIVTELLEPLQRNEVLGIVQYLAVNRNNLPGEFDGRLLARSRVALGRDLAASEKTYARDKFRKCVRGGLARRDS